MLRCASVLVMAILLVWVEPARGNDRDSVLRYVPRQADMAIVIEQPRRVIEAVMTFSPLQQLLTFPAVKEQLDSTAGQRAQQLIAYYERALGFPWPELLEKLAGGGATLALKFEGDNPPALLVVRANDEALMQKAFALVMDVAKTELERTDAAVKVRATTYRGFAGYQLGNGAFAALAGSVLFVANKPEALNAGLDLFINGAHESLERTGKPDQARRLLPNKPLAWTFISLDKLHAMSEAQESYRYPKGDPGQILFFQGLTDVIGKSSFVAIGSYQTESGFATTMRMPAGRNATPDGLALHLPEPGATGSLPLLEPKNVLFSTSFYLDVGKIVTHADKLFAEDTKKEITKVEQRVGRFLGGRKLSEVLTAVGPHHRFVMAAQSPGGYSVRPTTTQPAVAFVSDVRSPAYTESMNAILRTTALVLGLQAKLKIKEEKIGDVTLVTYRFPESAALTGDASNNRFNFSPCFAKVGNQFLMASTIELARELIPMLQKPEQNEPARGSTKTTRTRVYSDGGAALLKAFEDQLITQTILDRAVPIEQANKEADAFVNWLKTLGRLEFEIDYGPNDFRFDINHTWKQSPK